MESNLKFINKIFLKTLTATGLAFFLLSSYVSAHVVVSPKQVSTSERTTFSVSVPNEHDTPVVAVKLIIPEGVSSVRPHAKQGWKIEIIKSGEGDNAIVNEIEWSSDGADIPVDLKDEFLFSAKAPDINTELIWKAYETYADGRVVNWDQAPSDKEDNKPYSVSKVSTDSDQENIITETEEATLNATNKANRAIYLGVLGIAVGLIGIFFATRKK